MNNIYINNDYLINNPSLHEEDSPWKIAKLLPLVDQFAKITAKKEINLLDVGGGAGLILKAVGEHLVKNYSIRVNKYALDLSSGMLTAQKANNPELVKELNESICKTSLSDKEIDLVLMIDILEHVPDDAAALTELKRIARFSIFKVPLEDNFCATAISALKKNDSRRFSREQYGHVQFYRYDGLIGKIEARLGRILSVRCAGVYDYFLTSPVYNAKMKLGRKLLYWAIASLAQALPPKAYAWLFGDFAIILVKNY